MLTMQWNRRSQLWKVGWGSSDPPLWGVLLRCGPTLSELQRVLDEG